MTDITEPHQAGSRGRRGPAPPRNKGRDVSIDTLRGVAIILMVAGHVIGGTNVEGLQVADDSAWRIGYLLLADLRIPLFTALSGFVYGLRPLREAAQLRGFFRGKTMRLMLPLASVGTVFTILQAVVPGTNAESDLSSWWMLFFYGVWHFWFLQAIFILLLGIGIANACGWLTTQRSVVIAIGVASLLTVFAHVPVPFNLFSINGAIRLAPFFLLGYALSRFGSGHPRFGRFLFVATGILFVIRATQILAEVQLPEAIDTGLGLALGLTGIATLIVFRARMSWRPLAWLGFFSFSIYLLHVFGTAPARIFLERIDVTGDGTLFVLCLLAGLALPVIFEMTLSRIKWISWLFLGQKPYRGVPALTQPNTQ